MSNNLFSFGNEISSLSSTSDVEDLTDLNHNTLPTIINRNLGTESGEKVTKHIADLDDESSDTDSDDEAESISSIDANSETLDEDIASPQTERERHYSLLCEVDFVKSLPETMRTQIFSDTVVRKVKVGQLIVKQGESGNGMYIIMKGTARVSQVRPPKTEAKHITNLYEKMFFGESSLFYSVKRVASVVAVTDMTLLFLEKKKFDKLGKIKLLLLLKKLPMLHTLSIEAQVEVAGKLFPKYYQPGDVVVRKNDKGKAIFLILSGSAELYGQGIILKQGHMFGFNSFLQSKPRDATIVAKEKLCCLVINQEDITSLANETEFKELLVKESGKVAKTRKKRRDIRRSSFAESFGSGFDTANRYSLDVDSHGTKYTPPPSPISREVNLRVVSDKDGNRRVNDWWLKEKLGKGSFGTVYRCVHTKTNQVATIKVISKALFSGGDQVRNRQKRDLDDLYREVDIMKGLHHKNIVQTISFIDDATAQDLVIVMEYCAKRGIFDNSRKNDESFPPLSEDISRKYFRDVLCGLDYLHAQSIVHRDIKPMNLFVTADDVVKIGDFGTACKFDASSINCDGHIVSKLIDIAGTPAFMVQFLQNIII